ncbi:MAG: hypothetical protein DHS20C03_17470 [Minwuia thermotolerans]|nr:MAG: hypothetical protein DHS20C03_17470 [Minwuia thermotolerans]
MHELRRPTRKTIIQNVNINHLRRGDPLFPSAHQMRGNEAADEVWMIFLHYRTGLKPVEVTITIKFSEFEANEYKFHHPVGSELSEEQFHIAKNKDEMHDLIQNGFPFEVNSGDRESPLAFEILADAGIYRQGFGGLSQEVIDFLGEKILGELKSEYDENWQVVAAFEFCWLNLPHSSPAFVAASYQYHHYITEDDFSAGYHWRDLEVLAEEVEVEAQKAIETRKKAGESGSKKSAQAREARRTALMDAIEDVAERNPDVVKLGIVPLAQLALQRATEADPSLWRQGRGQVMEYAGEIRRGEAGEDLKARYEALYPAKPPKRFD